MYLTVPLGYCSEYMLSLNIGSTGLSETTRMSEIRRLYPILPYFLHMYQCLQNHNEMFAGSDNDI